MIYTKTSEQLELMRMSAQMVGKTLAVVAEKVRPGLTTEELDAIAEEFIRDNGGEPSFKGYNGFPASLCISVNDHVVHGIPGKKVIQDNDVVSVDCGVFMNGFHGDSAYSFLMGGVSDDVVELAEVTMRSLYLGIDQAVDGNRVGDISHAIQSYCEGENGYGIVRELVGHGIGKSLHEAPEVPNFGSKGRGPALRKGMTFAIEPMVNMGKRNVIQESDGWTIRTKDGSVSMHYEHTVAVDKGKAEILSTHEWVEEAIERNNNLIRVKAFTEQ